MFLIGINKKSFEIKPIVNSTDKYNEEQKRIQKDLLYVALTRAITELHILGSEKLNIPR